MLRLLLQLFRRRLGLTERLLAVLLAVLVVDFAANTLLFHSTDSFELRRDDAERIAENLVLASRALEQVPVDERPEVAAALSSHRFALEWTPPSKRYRGKLGLTNLREQVIDFEPLLAKAHVELHLEELSGHGNIGGSVRLSDNSLLKFHTHANAAWSLTAGRLVSMLLPTLLLFALAWILLRAVLGPLRALIAATRQFGADSPHLVVESGPDEMRQLIRAMNDMQLRIQRSLADRTQTMLAIGHDLKTPLARMRLRLDNESPDEDLRPGLSRDIDEMRQLIASLQAFVETGGEAIPTELIDLAAMAETLVDNAIDNGGNAFFFGASHAVVRVRPIQIRRALSNLIDNAIHYGGNARVTVRRFDEYVDVLVDDDGPGIPEDRLADVLQPFVRLDAARSRDTAGMGLGLPIVAKAVSMEGGSLTLENRPDGGLRATVRLKLAVLPRTA